MPTVLRSGNQSASANRPGIQCDDIKRRPPTPDNDAHPLGWMQTQAYLKLADRSLREKVILPFQERGIPLSEASLKA